MRKTCGRRACERQGGGIEEGGVPCRGRRRRAMPQKAAAAVAATCVWIHHEPQGLGLKSIPNPTARAALLGPHTRGRAEARAVRRLACHAPARHAGAHGGPTCASAFLTAATSG
jgi:hypothetical protein